MYIRFRMGPYYINPTRLCLSGGGIRTISYLGVLQVLSDEGILANIEEYIGVSAGGFIAFLLCIGYSLTEMIKIMSTVDFGDIRTINPENILEYDEYYGIDDGEGLRKFIISLIRAKGYEPELRFGELGGKRLRIIATDLHKLKHREFSAKLTPSVKIVDALRASMAVPFYFTPVRDPITNNLLTDGAVITNYPIIYLTPFDDHKNHNNEINSMMTFFHQIMTCCWINENSAIYSRYAKNTIIIPCSTYPAWNFEASEQDKKYLMKCGTDAAKNFLNVVRKQRPTYRRRSVS